MQIDGKRWTSSDDKKPAWNRAKLSIGAAGCALSPLSTHTPKYMKIHQHLWKSVEIVQIYENRRKTMKVLRWQEASLESSKGFYRGSRLNHKAGKALYPEIMKIHQNSWKSMKIDGNLWKTKKIDGKRWKSSDDKKPAWNRAKVSIGAAGWVLRRAEHYTPKSWKSIKSYENLWKSMEIYGKQRKSMENNESPQMTRSQPGIEQRFL